MVATQRPCSPTGRCRASSSRRYEGSSVGVSIVEAPRRARRRGRARAHVSRPGDRRGLHRRHRGVRRHPGRSRARLGRGAARRRSSTTTRPSTNAPTRSTCCRPSCRARSSIAPSTTRSRRTRRSAAAATRGPTCGLSTTATLFVLEVNTLPGMTATSLLPKIAKAAGARLRDAVRADPGVGEIALAIACTPRRTAGSTSCLCRRTPLRSGASPCACRSRRCARGTSRRSVNPPLRR